MINARLVLLLLALVCFALSAFETRFPRVNLLAAGLLFLTLVQLIA